MRYFSLLILLSLSKFTSGQLVFTKFDNVVLHDDFSYVSNRWEQKNTSAESFITSENAYVLKRLKNSYFAISVPKLADQYESFELITTVKLEGIGDNRNPSAGVVLKAQETGDGAVILEIDRKRQYRIRIMTEGKLTTLFGSDNDGWSKSKFLNAGGPNEIKIRTSGNQYDVYFNKRFERTFIESSFDAGKIGLYAGPLSSLSCDDITLRANAPKELKSVATGGDQTYTELALVFKTKIDKQQQEIDQLSTDLLECRSNLTMDTTAISQNKILREENETMKRQLVKLETEMETAKNRLSYLESMKADIEANTNGDLILNLTELLAREKSQNDALRKKVTELEEKLKK